MFGPEGGIVGGGGECSYYYVCNYKWQQQLHGLHKISNPCAAELMRRLFQLHNALLPFHLAAKMNKHPGTCKKILYAR